MGPDAETEASETESLAELAAWGAAAISDAFDAYQSEFRMVTARARERFEARDWKGAQQDALERLDLRGREVGSAVSLVRSRLGGRAGDRALWALMKPLYLVRISRRLDMELAETFYNSVTRRVFSTVGVDPRIEFVASELKVPLPDPGQPLYRTYPVEETAAVMRRILRDAGLRPPFENLGRDAGAAARQIDAYLGGRSYDAVDVLRPIFYRGKGAYLVGRLRQGASDVPLILALLHGEGGVRVDAVLLTENQASVLFSFTRSYFHVETERPSALVGFVKSILPQKRLSEIYTSIGFNKHGKTELYRELLAHLERSPDRFEPARGDRGMVMAVFTLPSLDVVFKVIRDCFKPPKNVTREEVINKYQLVFRHDRAGRLVDAQEFEHLTFPKSRFDARVLDELLGECGASVSLHGDQVDIRHLYAERRVTPLNLFVRETDEASARRAIQDFGQALRDLAATNTFPGDLLLKNFGVTRTGRVIFYDYDELQLLTEVNFREMPRASSDDDMGGAEPSFYVGENDVFPEEFLPFLGLQPHLRAAFLESHAELLTARFWREMQERHRAGEIIDIFPYDRSRRLGGAP
ncbi:MAG TPA: bifunctional isocitrate dehydrogenase kinase/phosphatase [Anaeromyxobacteraceae bacterium]|nr:bifunctional isocitrate dehydrogenase kinase/phosphatase [Anaeromyxobacteraceae bacterium]